jgi:hypothetical protein
LVSQLLDVTVQALSGAPLTCHGAVVDRHREQFCVGANTGVSLTAIHDERKRPIGCAKITPDLTEQRRQQSEIERAIPDKETLLKEVYHRVKNNLQVVQGLLTLSTTGPVRWPGR